MKPRLQALRRSLDRAGGKISEESLIRFDFRVFLLTFILVLLFALSVGFKLHGSSIGYWDVVFPEARAEKTGLIAGRPKSIRSDEWLVGTPWMLSQYQQGYPVHNYNIGASNDPLLNNIPARHFTTIFKPQNWGYFSLGVERGFSFWWNFKIFGPLGGFFLLLMLLTRNHFWLSLTGALWVLLSGFTQWWFSTMMVELLASFAMMFVGLCYLFLARKKALVAAGAVLLTVFGLDFVLFFYPPFQVPLGWLTLFLVGAYFTTGNRWQLLRSGLKTRLPIAAGLGLLAAVVLYVFYKDTRETITAILYTDYPGRRVALGGDTGFVRMFSGFTWAPYGELGYPSIWSNACETSNFIILFPVVLIAWLRNYILKVRNERIVTVLLAYMLMISAWVLVRFPLSVAKLSLLSYVPSNRILLGLGVGSILTTIVYLAGSDSRPIDRAFARNASIVIFVLLSLYGLLYIQMVNTDFHLRYVVVMSGFFSLLSWLLLIRRRTAFSVLILLALTPYLVVNPVTQGMSPIFENRIYQTGSELAYREPDARWIVYGNPSLAAMLKASGMKIVNGAKYTPDLDFYSAIDPTGANRAIYNRYAHTTFNEPALPAEPATFRLLSGDAYAVDISPCSENMKKLGIDHFAFSKKPGVESLSCLELVEDIGNMGAWFYVRKI
ncbi:MAG: DUF7657 domain-containing protein [Thermoleophilia bacterium]